MKSIFFLFSILPGSAQSLFYQIGSSCAADEASFLYTRNLDERPAEKASLAGPTYCSFIVSPSTLIVLCHSDK
jgi:hypothetical protein